MQFLVTSPRVVVISLLSVALAVGVSFENGWEGGLDSIVLALIGILLSIVLEIAHEQHQMKVDGRRAQAKLLEQLGLHKEVLVNDTISEMFNGAVRCANSIDKKIDDKYGLCHSHFNRLAAKYMRELEHLTAGEIHLTGSSAEIWKESAKLVEKTVANGGSGRTVSYTPRRYDQHNSADSFSYENACRRAVESGSLELKRIFIVSRSSGGEDLNRVEKIIGEQAGYGIEACLVIDEEIPPEMKTDFALWGDCYLAKSEYADDGSFLHGLHSANASLFKRYRDRFDLLADRAVPFDSDRGLADQIGVPS